MSDRLSSIFLSLLVLLSLPVSAEPSGPRFTSTPHRAIEGDVPQSVVGLGADLEMIVDDGTAEGDVGVNGAAAFQFLWLNRLTPPGPLFLDQIHVLFPADPNLAPGDPIDLVVYRDEDGDPANGADLLAVFSEQIQVADGVTFSVYPVTLDEIFRTSEDLYLGVIPRFIDSGVTVPTHPAALDATTPQGRSWIVTWQGDPPASPLLPSDNQTVNIDDLSPGNWLIRGFGRSVPIVEIPTASTTGLLVLGLLVLAAALVALRRRALAA